MVAEKREAIALLRAEVTRDPAVVWQLEPVLKATRERLGHGADSVEATLLGDHLAERALDARTRELGVGALMLGLGAGTMLAREAKAAGLSAEQVLGALDEARSLPGVGRAARVDAAIAERLTEVFGSDAKEMLARASRADLRELAEPSRLARLAELGEAERRSVLALVGRGVSPRVVDEVLELADRLQPGTGGQVLRYLAGQPAAEVRAAQSMLRLEVEHQGHAVLRHGPHLDRGVLEARLRTGVASDGVVSPAPASTRFRSFRMMQRAYEDARETARTALGVDLKKGPGPGGKAPEKTYEVVIEYGKPISRGYLKAGMSRSLQIETPTGSKTVKVWSAVRPSDELVTRTRATFKWDGTRWRVVQLFPDATKLDSATGRYLQRADKYVRR